jgi:D-galactose 1-dehydrogenase/L-arabinose 1- dehydrogenase
MSMRSAGAPIIATLDFLHTGPQEWDIDIETDRGTLRIAMGGRLLSLPGEAERHFADEEYPRLYDRFADLIARRARDVDVIPSVLVADALAIAQRREGAPFAF